jgi:DNA-binding MurR/RpiR family transcriptional regulator
MDDAPLADRIKAKFATLPLKQQAVARILADKPSAVALSSVNDLARTAGVDAATVVRTCQSLGYSGWRELLGHVKGDLARQRTFADRVLELGTEEGNLTARIYENALRNVEETFQGLDDAALDRTAAALSTAETVLVVAGGASRGAGEYLRSSLQIIGLRANLVPDVSEAAGALATLGPDDVVVGISMWRYLKPTVQIMRYAKEALGAKTAVLTDNPVSAATQFADHVLVAKASTVGPRLSLTGAIALVEALVAKTALQNPWRSRAAAGVASDFYSDGHVVPDSSSHLADKRDSTWAATLARELGDE